MSDYWQKLIGEAALTEDALFLRIRDLYTAYLRRLYNDPSGIPDFRIHFGLEQRTVEEGMDKGYPVATVSKSGNDVTRFNVPDVFALDNFQYSYTWYQDDVFVVFDYRETGISPLQFITASFFNAVMQQLQLNGVGSIRIAHMFAPMISSGVSQFFYGFYALDINLIQTLSAMTYEGASINCSILVPKYDVNATSERRRNDLDIELRDPVTFNVEHLRQVRKIVEMSDKHLAVSINSAGRIVGLTKGETWPSECRIRMWGHLSYTISYDGGKKISYYNARYHIHSTTSSTDLRKSLAPVSDSLDTEAMKKLQSVIERAARSSHGTILIIADPETAVTESDRLVGVRRADGIVGVDLSKDLSLVDALSNIDGAIVMDTSCVCSCIGAILDGDAVAEGSLARGSRYNSTVNYIRRRAQLGQTFAGVVVSEDGSVDAVTAEHIHRLNIR